jgi:hypothetical protein
MRYAALLVLSLLLAAAMADGGKQKDEGSVAGQGGQNTHGSGCLPPKGAKTLGQVVLLLLPFSRACQAHLMSTQALATAIRQQPAVG